MFRIQEATTAAERMNELCRFIDYWIGPRRPEYGEPDSELAKYSLPEPLRHLYAFAGRWPPPSKRDYLETPFACQDQLVPLRNLFPLHAGKLVFLHENQGVWDCRTLPGGDDPPVWWHGEVRGEDDTWTEGERLECDSLSRFLVTYVLQELTVGSKRLLGDERLQSMFMAGTHEVVPLWIDGPYVEDRTANFYLFESLLVMRHGESCLFGTNTESGIAFIEANQARIVGVGIDVGFRWSLRIGEDGSARVRFSDGRGHVLLGQCPAKSFEFAGIRDDLLVRGSDTGSYIANPTVTVPRAGQHETHPKHVHDWDVIHRLFKIASASIATWQGDLQRHVKEEWGCETIDRELLLRLPEGLPESLVRLLKRRSPQ